MVFAIGALTLAAAGWAIGQAGGFWWAIGAWGVALAVHYLVHKARSVDPAWVDERTAELRSKSYDASHIDSIAERYGGDPARPDEPRK